ncbi:MAG: hypothetical protein U0794_22275 [Isosphaeraceae bacterium]
MDCTDTRRCQHKILADLDVLNQVQDRIVAVSEVDFEVVDGAREVGGKAARGDVEHAAADAEDEASAVALDATRAGEAAPDAEVAGEDGVTAGFGDGERGDGAGASDDLVGTADEGDGGSALVEGGDAARRIGGDVAPDLEGTDGAVGRDTRGGEDELAGDVDVLGQRDDGVIAVSEVDFEVVDGAREVEVKLPEVMLMRCRRRRRRQASAVALDATRAGETAPDAEVVQVRTASPPVLAMASEEMAPVPVTTWSVLPTSETVGPPW